MTWYLEVERVTAAIGRYAETVCHPGSSAGHDTAIWATLWADRAVRVPAESRVGSAPYDNPGGTVDSWYTLQRTRRTQAIPPSMGLVRFDESVRGLAPHGLTDADIGGRLGVLVCSSAWRGMDSELVVAWVARGSSST